MPVRKKKAGPTNEVFIAVCLSRSGEGEAENFLVKDKRGRTVFRSMEEADKAVAADMREYAKAEREAGYKCRIAGRHLEWSGRDCDDLNREARWYIYGVNPKEAECG